MRSAGFRSANLSTYTDVYFIFIFSILLLNPALRMSHCCMPRAFFSGVLGQPYSLTSLACAVGFLGDLAMCMAAKGWHPTVQYLLAEIF